MKNDGDDIFGDGITIVVIARAKQLRLTKNSHLTSTMIDLVRLIQRQFLKRCEQYMLF
jgi:hypothetical protein